MSDGISGTFGEPYEAARKRRRRLKGSKRGTTAAAWTISQNSSLIDRFSELKLRQFQEVARTAACGVAGVS